MRNKMKAVLLTLTIAAAALQPVSVLAAPKAAFTSEPENALEKDTEDKAEEDAAVQITDVSEGDVFTDHSDHSALDELREKKVQYAKEKAEERAKAEAKRIKKIRKKLVKFARQFEGNPYVYGGTSLTNGADCSGFVMSVFAEFGYELPRVADAQYASSEQKELADLQIGDLLFYGDYGINHVALYIGKGKIIHASTAATGIKISDYDYANPVGVGNYIK